MNPRGTDLEIRVSEGGRTAPAKVGEPRQLGESMME